MPFFRFFCLGILIFNLFGCTTPATAPLAEAPGVSIDSMRAWRTEAWSLMQAGQEAAALPLLVQLQESARPGVVGEDSLYFFAAEQIVAIYMGLESYEAAYQLVLFQVLDTARMYLGPYHEKTQYFEMTRIASLIETHRYDQARRALAEFEAKIDSFSEAERRWIAPFSPQEHPKLWLSYLLRGYQRRTALGGSYLVLEEYDQALAQLRLAKEWIARPEHMQLPSRIGERPEHERLLSLVKEIMGGMRVGLWTNMGQAYEGLGMLDSAMWAQEKSLSHYAQIDDVPNRVITLINLAGLEQKRGHLEAAHGYLTQALTSCQEAETYGQGGLIAEVYLDLGQLEQAAGRYEVASAHFTAGLESLGWSSQDTAPANPSQQLPPAQLSLSLLDGAAMSQWAHLEQVSGTTEDSVLHDITRLYRAYFHLLDSLAATEGYFELEEGLRFRRQLAGAASRAVAAAYRLSQSGQAPSSWQALDFVAASRSAILHHSLLRRASVQFGDLEPGMLDQERLLRAQLAFARTLWQVQATADQGIQADDDPLRRQWETAEQQWQAWRVRLKRDCPRYFALRHASRSALSPDIMAPALREGMVYLTFFAGEDVYYRFVLTPDTLAISIVGATVEIDSLVAVAYRNLLQPHRSVPAQHALAGALHGLYVRLIPPSMMTLRSVDDSLLRLRIIPDGELHRLPFELLLTRVPEAVADPGQWPYWVRDSAVAFSYPYALRVDARGLRESPGYAQDFVGVAPAYADQPSSLPALEGSRSLLTRYAALPCWGGRSQLFLGTSTDPMTEEKCWNVAQDAQVLHLSVHARANDEDPLASALYLDGGDSVAARALYAAQLHTGLLVLEACEGGEGEVWKGEGVMSLARGAAYAGASSVLASSWVLRARSSGELLSLFYEEVGRGLPKDIAWSQARRRLFQVSTEPLDPHFWGSMRLYGEVDPLVLDAGAGHWTGWAWGLLLVLGVLALGWGLRRLRR